MAGVLIGLVVLFTLLSDHFLSLRTFTTIANQVPDLTALAVGMTFVLMIGGIDLSVGAVLALSGAAMGVVLVDWGWPLPMAICAAMGVGALVGFVNGAISSWWAVPSFIVTLGMMEVARGAAYRITNSQTKYIGSQLDVIAEPIRGLGITPAFLAAAVTVIVGHLVLTRTVLGRYMTAIGTNEEAVRLSGINTRSIKVYVFVIAGLLSGLGGVFQSARLSSADPNAGIAMELSAIAAAVIGGTSLMGGRGSVISTFFGVLIIALLQTGLAQVGVSEPSKRIITGSVIVAAVMADTYRRRYAAGRRRGRKPRKPGEA
ncbi:MAG: ABC transporter permease [Phycisphaeraceae bacterium]|nr:ABC transporter permease [Phycisphaeraceae bacterium]